MFRSRVPKEAGTLQLAVAAARLASQQDPSNECWALLHPTGAVQMFRARSCGRGIRGGGTQTLVVCAACCLMSCALRAVQMFRSRVPKETGTLKDKVAEAAARLASHTQLPGEVETESEQGAAAIEGNGWLVGGVPLLEARSLVRHFVCSGGLNPDPAYPNVPTLMCLP